MMSRVPAFGFMTGRKAPSKEQQLEKGAKELRKALSGKSLVLSPVLNRFSAECLGLRVRDLGFQGFRC